MPGDEAPLRSPKVPEINYPQMNGDNKAIGLTGCIAITAGLITAVVPSVASLGVSPSVHIGLLAFGIIIMIFGCACCLGAIIRHEKSRVGSSRAR